MSLLSIPKEFWLAGALTTPLLLWWYFNRIRHSSLRMSKQKTERLYALAKSGKWSSAGPLALQIAVSDAFRAEIDDRWIVFAMRRHRPMGLLRDMKRAGASVRLEGDSGFVDSAKGRRFSLKARSWILFAFAFFPWILLACTAGIESLPAGYKIGFLISGFYYIPFFVWQSICVNAAHILVTELDEKYPLVDEVNKESIGGAKRSIKPRKVQEKEVTS